MSITMNDPTQLNSVPFLDGEIWKDWFFRMENHLRLNGLWAVTMSEPTKEEKEKDKTILEVFGFAKIFFSVPKSQRSNFRAKSRTKKIFFFRKITPISELFLEILCARCSEMGGGIQYSRDTIPHVLHVL